MERFFFLFGLQSGGILFKIKNHIHIISTLCLLTTTQAFSANTASTTVSIAGQVISDLSININEDLRFGEIAAAENSEAATGVTIAVTDQSTGAFSITYASGSSPDVSADSTGTESTTAITNRTAIGPGKVTVSGESGYHYAATAPTFASGVVGGVSMRVDTFSGSRQLNNSGQDIFYVGGVFTAANGVTPGIQAGTIEIVVTYD